MKIRGIPAFRALTVCVLTASVHLASPQTTSRSPEKSDKTSASSVSSKQFDEIAKRASQAREQNNLEEAVRLYRGALKIKPTWLEGWWDLGTILYDSDRYEEARPAFRRVTNLKPDGAPAWAMLGLCEFEMHDYAPGLQHLSRAQAMGGMRDNQELNSVAQYHLATLYTRFEQYDAATKVLFNLAREGDESPSLIEALGLSVLRMPFLPAEMPADKREIVLMSGRAAYDMRNNRPADGKREFEELVARYGNTANVHYAYGSFLLTTDADAALGQFNREIQISPNHVEARLQIAFESVKRGEFASGLPFAQKAVELAPRSFAAHDALGRVLLGMGKMDEAIGELETAVKLAPDSPEVRFALYTAYARAGRKVDAEHARAEFMRLDKLRKN